MVRACAVLFFDTLPYAHKRAICGAAVVRGACACCLPLERIRLREAVWGA